MCEERLRKRFPTFIDFCVWAMSQEGIISSDGYDLRGLTTLPADVKFPAEFCSLYLSEDLEREYCSRKSKK